MLPKTTLTFLGFKGAEEELDGVAKRLNDWGPIEGDIHDMLLFRMEELFSTAGSSEGTPWPGYEAQEPKYGTLKAKLVKRGIIEDPSLLRFKGAQERLYPSLVKPSHPEHIFKLSGRSIEFGTRVPYARIHDEGGAKNQFGEPIPMRNISRLSDRNVERLMQLIYIYVVRGKT